jgi:hypothetical protein
MSDPRLTAIRDLIQEDVGNRGLRTDPNDNLITACPDDFEAACRSIAEHPAPAVGVVTGFFIPHAQPPAGETDGPLGAIFLARALAPLGVRVVLATDAFAVRALEVSLRECGLRNEVPLVTLPSPDEAASLSPAEYGRRFADRAGALTHLVALERVGPSYTPEELRQRAGDAVAAAFAAGVPPEHHDRCHSMRGRDITAHMSPAHHLFEGGRPADVITVGIGDGGNEIGMGKVPWEVIRRNIPGGERLACRTATDRLIVCGVSNWGAYGLAAGVRLLRGRGPDDGLFDVARERELLRAMVEEGPLVDGVTGQPTVTVDGLPFERYAAPLRRLAEIGP